jgi:hypothetical protein
LATAAATLATTTTTLATTARSLTLVHSQNPSFSKQN